MESVCHRCGNTLQEGEVFCRHCGAPQLVVETAEPGAPSQPAMRFQSDPHQVQWRAAILSALVMAVPLGLFSGLIATSLVLVLVAGFLTIVLYDRRAAGLIDGRMGWRVGSILGAAAALLACGSYAVRMVIERYAMHGGAAIDSAYQAFARQYIDVWSKTMAQQGAPTAETAHMMKSMTAFMLSPDGHAALQLMTAAMMSAGILLFAALGGFLGGLWQSRGARSQRTL